MPQPRLIITIVRHGETEENRKRIIQGHLDTKLNDTGKQQAKLVAAALAKPDVAFTHAFSSDLSRAKETAEEILRFHPHLELITHQSLREQYLGSAQGKKWQKPPQDMESSADVRARALQWWDQTIAALLAGVEGDDDGGTLHALVVSHGGLIRNLVETLVSKEAQRLSPLHPDERIGSCFNTAVTVIHVNGPNEGKLVSYASISHLIGKPSGSAPLVAFNVDEVAAASV